MVSEEKAKELLFKISRNGYDGLGYGKRVNSAFGVEYIVGKKRMTLTEYQNYCYQKLLKDFDLK